MPTAPNTPTPIAPAANLAVLTLTDLRIHDPSTLAHERGTYYIFGTGAGIPVFASTNLIHWQARGRVFDTLPAWITAAVPEIRGTGLWAPDIRHVGDRWRLYYSASTFGQNTSAIGLATTPTLAAPRWEDRGLVVQSKAGDDFNAIDPAIVASPDGHDFGLTCGSFWSGIQAVRLDPTTGLTLTPPARRAVLAANPRERYDAIEASFVYARGGWFYLFVNWGLCCKGADSTYNIRVGRSRSWDGPYVDRDGVPLAQNGGTLFLDAANSDRTLVGPGHAGILDERRGAVFTCHFEYARANGGRPTLAVARVAWDRDGWPSLRPL